MLEERDTQGWDILGHLFWSDLDMPVFVLGRSGQVLEKNPSAHKLMEASGYTRLQNISELVPSFDLVPLTPLDSEKQNSDVSPQHSSVSAAWHEVLVKHTDGSVQPWRCHMVKLSDSSILCTLSEIVAASSAVSFSSDRTEPGNDSAAGHSQAQKLEALGSLSSGIAHDFNNILASILGAAEVALEYISDDHKAHRYVTTVQRAGLRGKDLVQRILSFARPAPEELTVFVLQDLLLECFALLRPMVPNSVELSYDLGDQEVWITGDKSQLLQVFTSLVTNAVQSINRSVDSDGVISITLRTCFEANSSAELSDKKDWVVVTVRDTGEGLSQENLARVFDPFNGTKESANAAGLGLSTVQSIVKSHSGYIHVDSVADQGATFSVYLPQSDPLENTEERSAENLSAPRGNGQRILLVDDEPWLLDVGSATLELLNYIPDTCGSPNTVLERITSDPDLYHAVITDYWMPEMSGVELARRIRELVPNMPIIVVTGNKDFTDVKRQSDISVNDILIKPLTRNDLAISLSRLW